MSKIINLIGIPIPRLPFINIEDFSMYVCTKLYLLAKVDTPKVRTYTYMCVGKVDFVNILKDSCPLYTILNAANSFAKSGFLGHQLLNYLFLVTLHPENICLFRCLTFYILCLVVNKACWRQIET